MEKNEKKKIWFVNVSEYHHRTMGLVPFNLPLCYSCLSKSSVRSHRGNGENAENVYYAIHIYRLFDFFHKAKENTIEALPTPKVFHLQEM